MLSLLTALFVPGVSYLFIWPAIAAGLAANWRTVSPGPLASFRFAVVAAPTVMLMTPAVEFFFQFGQPRPGNPDSSIPAIAGMAVLLVALVGGLLRGVWRQGLRSAEPTI